MDHRWPPFERLMCIINWPNTGMRIVVQAIVATIVYNVIRPCCWINHLFGSTLLNCHFNNLLKSPLHGYFANLPHVGFSIRDPISVLQHVGQMICFQWWFFSYNKNDVLFMEIKLSNKCWHIYSCYKLLACGIFMLLEMETSPQVPKLGSIHYITLKH
jgi:hypothetical protein